MHGIKRSTFKRAPSAEEKRKKDAKRDKYGKLQSALLKMRRAANPEPKRTLMLTGQLLAINPNFYTLWNFRREALEAVRLKEISAAAASGGADGGAGSSGGGAVGEGVGGGGGEDTGGGEGDGEGGEDGNPLAIAKAVGPWELEDELDLTERILTKRDPKSYGAWTHRLWSVRRTVATAEAGQHQSAEAVRQVGKELLQDELEKCTLMLKKDERNFHCWAYRRTITALLCHLQERGDRWKDDLAFAMAKIEANFSNYSAWHEVSA